jgi:hypothetical protein
MMAVKETRRTDSTADTIREDDAARRILGTLAEASAEAGDRIVDAAGSAGVAVREADRTLRRSSDQTLGILGGLSIGTAVGLLAAGSSRFLVTAALVPAVFVAGAVLERIERQPQRSEPIH